MSERPVVRYYDQPLIGEAGVAGAGLIWFMSEDHLSPPTSNKDEYALNAHRWREATSSRILNMASRMALNAHDLVLDLGTGIGGPGRDIISTIGCRVVGLNLSSTQLSSLRKISTELGSPYLEVVQGDMENSPFQDGIFDAAVSVNSLYHVTDHKNAITEVGRILKPEGKFGLDDWFTTIHTHPESLRRLRHNWSTPPGGFHSVASILNDFEQAGLPVTDVTDFTQEAGAFLTEERFGSTFDTQIAPVLVSVFPTLYQYDGYRHEHAQEAASQLRPDALYMGELYRNRQAAYLQIIGQKA